MDTKEYLSSLGDIDKEIQLDIRRLGDLRVRIMNISAHISDDRVQTSMSDGKISNLMADIIDLENEISEKMANYYTLYYEILEKAKKLCIEEESIIVEKYLLGKSFNEIAETLGRSRRYVIYTHNKAIADIKI